MINTILIDYNVLIINHDFFVFFIREILNLLTNKAITLASQSLPDAQIRALRHIL